MPATPRSLHSCPELSAVAERIFKLNPLQRKRIEAFLSEQAPEYFEFAEGLSQTLNHELLSDEPAKHEAAKHEVDNLAVEEAVVVVVVAVEAAGNELFVDLLTLARDYRL